MSILDFIFPEYCVYCQKDLSDCLQPKASKLEFQSFRAPFNRYLCQECFLSIQQSLLKCPVCGLINETGFPCLACQKKSFVDRLTFYGSFGDPVLKRAIHGFKYQGLRALVFPLAELMIYSLEKAGIEKRLSRGLPGFCSDNARLIVSFIPLHPRKRRWRGFNQAELLASKVGQYFDIPVKKLLKRKYFTPAQVSILEFQKRHKNIKNLFEYNPPEDSRNLTLDTCLLIDDVATSGATLQEAAYILKKAGFKEVWGVTLAG